MDIFLEFLNTYLILITAVLLLILLWKSMTNFDYWKTKGVPFVKPLPFFGNIKDKILLKLNTAEIVKNLYNELKGHKYGGYFEGNVPCLFLRDPELIKAVMTRDFNYFQDRNPPEFEKGFALGEHLVFLTGYRWRKLRTKLTPAFTSGKIKMMIEIMEKCASELTSYIDSLIKDQDTLDMKEIAAKFSTDVIGSCAFGLSMDSFKNPNSDFRKMGKKVFEPSMLEGAITILVHFFPFLMRFVKPPYASDEVSNFFCKTVKDSMDSRKKHNIVRNDFIQLLIELKNKGKIDDSHGLSNEDLCLTRYDKHIGEYGDKFESLEVTDNLLAAQCFIFFLTGLETTSRTIGVCIYELACHPEIQEKVFDEVSKVLKKYNNKISYETLQEMKYLDQVVKETLRISPPVGDVPRICTKEYTIPGTSVVIEKGTWVIIPVLALHHDPEYFPNPDRFDPERFSENNVIPPFTFLPFGEGPRMCIGLRFALVEIKLAVATLVSRYEFSVCDKTIIPIKYKLSKVTMCTCDLWLRVTHRKTDTREHA